MVQKDMEEAIAWLRKHGITSVLLELPPGLMHTTIIREMLEDAGVEVWQSMEPVHGACDINLHEAARAGVGAVLHIGHYPMIPSTPIPVYYLPLRKPFPVESLETLALPDNIAIAAITQYVHLLPEVKKTLEEKGKKVFIASGERTPVPVSYTHLTLPTKA